MKKILKPNFYSITLWTHLQSKQLVVQQSVSLWDWFFFQLWWYSIN